MQEDKVKTGRDIEWMELKIAHDLPPVKLATWIHHDKPSNPRVLRCTSVSILTESGHLFTGVSVCSELDQFSKKEGFNRAYGLACQKLALCERNKELAEHIDLSRPITDISRWVTNHAYNAKLDAIKTIYANRLKMAQMKGKHDVYAPVQ